jgi:copper resistance protein B
MSRRSRAAARWLASVASLAGLCALADAQMAVNEASAAAPFGAPIEDQSIFFHAELDQFEERLDAGANALRWDGALWIGSDENRVWLKSEGFVSAGLTRDGQDEALYDRPISSYFELQTGIRYDLDSYSGRGWGAIGLQGLAPFDLEVSATAYASSAGHYALKFTAAYELLLTQRLILEPQVELNGYTRPDEPMQIRAGWSQLDTGLRLRYEIQRKLAPYLGATYSRTAVAASSQDQWRFIAGVRLWY